MNLNISNGYVVYERGEYSKSPIWRSVHRQAIRDAFPMQNLYSKEINKFQAAGDRLISIGNREREKELALIREALGEDFSYTEDIRDFIKNFNTMLVGKKQFEDTIERLNAALQEGSQKKEFRAPVISSWFSSALGTALNQRINKFISTHQEELLQQDYSAWDAQFNSIIDKAIDDAWKKLMTKLRQESGKELYGKEETWKQIYEMSQQLPNFPSSFREMIRSKIDFNQIKRIFQNEAVDIKKKTRRGIRKVIDSQEGLNLRSGRKSRAIGGSVQEFVDNIATLLGDAAKKATQKGSTGATVFKQEKMVIDNVTVFSFEEEINVGKGAQAIVDSLNEAMNPSASLKQSVDIMNQYWNEHLSKLDKTFVVYGSTKAYTLSDSFSRFHAGGSRDLEYAKQILAQAGFDQKKVNKFVNMAYNTGSGPDGIIDEETGAGDGAIFFGHKDDISEQLKISLASAVANILFDDWVSIGEQSSGAQAIHVLQLDALQLPLSVFLIAAGEALKQAAIKRFNQLISIKLTLPAEILYPEPIAVEKGSMSEMIGYWNEQAEVAKNQSNFSLDFLKNFKQMLTEWIEF